MRPFYWVILRHGREEWPLGYYVDRATGQAKIDELNARVRELAGNVTYELRSDEGSASNVLGPIAEDHRRGA